MNKITPEHIKSRIKRCAYYVLPGTTVTICMMELENGYSVIGKSACADPATFNPIVGENYAYADAFDQVWPLEGYLLKERMHQMTLPTEQPE
jgi:hypothetical protein